mgnify:CR=1 FL=1
MLTIQTLDLNDAQIMIKAGQAKALELGVPICIAVVDEGGHLIAFEKMDGAKLTSSVIAQDKAFTAAAMRRETHLLNELAQPGSPAHTINTEHAGRISCVGGGLPVKFNGAVVGGIGASSGTPGQDQEIVQAGIDAWLAQQ